MSGKFTTTTKDVGLLTQLHQDGQLTLTPEFQRNTVWSRPARAFLLDTMLEGYPIPVLYFQRQVSAQTNRVSYAVVDGQQRLSSVFAFLDNKFSLTESDPSRPWHRKRWKQLEDHHKERILSYDFTIQEISGYRSEDIREMFRRMNKYVVALNPQEYRHSDTRGAFKETVESVGAWDFWLENKVVSSGAARRMRDDELSAELLILLNEGAQDKKTSVDLYYDGFREDFSEGEVLTARLRRILDVIETALPDLSATPLRRPAQLYSLVGAIAELEDEEESAMPRSEVIGERLRAFMAELSLDEEHRPTRASEYLLAASRQTDNIRPRQRRIDILKQVISGG